LHRTVLAWLLYRYKLLFNYICFYILLARIRLINGSSPNIGRVEIYTNSTGGVDNAQWGTICDNDWDILDARVVCHQLGYLDAVAAPTSAYYGQGIGPIWLDNVQCFGTEPDLIGCRYNRIGENHCEHGCDASAECLGMSQIYFCLR